MIKIANHKGQPEIFHSIQGEGISMGKPSVFVRTSLCNLYCIWCDTDYTWNWEGTSFSHVNDQKIGYQKFKKSEQILHLSTSEIVGHILKFNCQNIIFTGGEPLVQHKELVEVMEQLIAHNPAFRFETETNGTLIPNPNYDALVHQYNVSPKLSNSKVDIKDRIKAQALHFFAKNHKSNFKFVIDHLQDLKEVLALIDQFQIPSDKVILMPQGTQSESLKTKRKWLTEVCLQYQFRFSDRMHVHIWGEKRGV